MGTNYYLEKKDPCPHCGRGFDRLHIGKFSNGWIFALHVIPELHLFDLRDWQKFWEGEKIFDEYGQEFSGEDMLKLIKEIVNNSNYIPKRLIIGNHSCIGHGEYCDYIVGEFS